MIIDNEDTLSSGNVPIDKVRKTCRTGHRSSRSVECSFQYRFDQVVAFGSNFIFTKYPTCDYKNFIEPRYHISFFWLLAHQLLMCTHSERKMSDMNF